MSMVDFICVEYSDGKVVADQKIRERIVEVGIRTTARATKLDTKTVMSITRGEGTKPSTLAKVVRFINEKQSPDGEERPSKRELGLT